MFFSCYLRIFEKSLHTMALLTFLSFYLLKTKSISPTHINTQHKTLCILELPVSHSLSKHIWLLNFEYRFSFLGKCLPSYIITFLLMISRNLQLFLVNHLQCLYIMTFSLPATGFVFRCVLPNPLKNTNSTRK